MGERQSLGAANKEINMDKLVFDMHTVNVTGVTSDVFCSNLKTVTGV